MPRQTLTQKLEAARLLIFNSRTPEIAPLLNTIGIDTAYLDQGETLYYETVRLVDNQKDEQQEQSLAFDTFYLAKDDAEADFKRTLKLVKVLSRNDTDLQNRIGIPRGSINAIEAWIESTINFYNRLLNETAFLTSLARFQITPERLITEKAAIENLRVLRNKTTAEKGQAQEATRLRNEKLDELNNYTTELKAIAELALENQPQLLENLGIVVRS
jgi:hypothetical protein